MRRSALVSQGEVRPGVVQGQCWREWKDRYYTIGLNGERIPVYVIGGIERLVERSTPSNRADPRLSCRETR